MMLLHVLIVISAMSMPSADAAETHHHHQDRSADLQLDNGERWQTDAPLRLAMEEINAAITQHLHAAHTGTMEAAEYAALASLVNERVAWIVRNCELPAKADAELHKLIGMLGAASAAMHGETDARQGFTDAVRTMQLYGEHFAHPGWISPQH